MAQITIDTNVIVSMIVGLFALIGVIAMVVLVGSYVGQLPPSPPVITPEVVPVEIPNVVTIPYPSVLTFTVLSTTTSNGRYQVTTTSGNILYFKDYAEWYRMYPRSTYTATIIGSENGAYQVDTVTLLSGYYGNYYGEQNGYRYGSQNIRYVAQDLPTYWHYGNKFYQCDRVVCDPMMRKQIIGEIINEGRPPRPIRE
jgi:hypothetical protein